MRMNNIEIRTRIFQFNLRKDEVAKAAGISKFTFSHWLQTELPPDKKERIMQAIESIKT